MLDFGKNFIHRLEKKEGGELFPAPEEEDFSLSSRAASPKDDEAWNETDAEEAAPRGEIKRVPMPGHCRSKKNGSDEPEKQRAAEALLAAREKAGLTREMVAENTKIRTPFLEALENGRFEELPQAVFVLAYLRRLCRLYLVSPEDEEMIVRPWLDLQCEIPENLPAKVVVDTESENSRIIRKVEIGLFAAAAVVIVGLLLMGGIMLISRFSKDDRPVPFDESVLLELQPDPVLTPASSPSTAKTGR